MCPTICLSVYVHIQPNLTLPLYLLIDLPVYLPDQLTELKTCYY